MTNEEAVVRAKTGDLEAVEFLWVNNQGLIRSKVSCIHQESYALDDLLQEAYFSMVFAIEHYDAEKGHKFSTYLGKILVWKALRKRQQEKPIGSLTLNIPLAEDSELEMVDNIMDERAVYPEEAAAQSELRSILDEAISRLPGRMAECITRSYFKGEQQATIADDFGVSYSQISTDVRNGLARLRNDGRVRAAAADYIGAYYGVGVGAFKNNGFTSSTERIAIRHVDEEARRLPIDTWLSSWDLYWQERNSYSQAYKLWVKQGRPAGREPVEPTEPPASFESATPSPRPYKF